MMPKIMKIAANTGTTFIKKMISPKRNRTTKIMLILCYDNDILVKLW